MMKVTVLESDENKIVFEMKDTTPVFANTLRRSIMDKIPVMAAENVAITKNTSALYDEMLAHRVGMIPIKFPISKYVMKSECDCKGKGCSKCEVKGVLNKSGKTTVYARDIKFADENVQAKNPEDIVVTLIGNQEVKLELTARLGTGKEHARWQPAIAGYKYYPELKIDKYCEKCQKELKSAPSDIVDKQAGKIKNPLAIDMFKATIGACKEDAAKLDSDPTRIIFTVETVSGLDPKAIVLEAVSTFEKELKDFESEIK